MPGPERPPGRLTLRRRHAFAAAALVVLGLAAPAAARSNVVRAGAARFEVLTSTLMRLEYATDGHFENRATMTATRAPLPAPPFAVSRARGWLTIRTRALTLRYRLGSGPFAGGNLLARLIVAGKGVTVDPAPGDAQGNLGGWRRGLDLLDSPVQL
ncbi:MAG TPA: hypothetical protein VMP89_00865, partial [Solirubrobacteraceae bacterium]|nr:hypothetical protein [Solirubrobacteraceae bacterium]